MTRRITRKKILHFRESRLICCKLHARGMAMKGKKSIIALCPNAAEKVGTHQLALM
jgi:hypothetical protein